MRIISIDQSLTNCGVCIFDSHKLIHCEVIRTPAGDDLFDRIDTIATRLIALAQQYNVEYVCLESLAFGAKGNSLTKLAGLQAIIIDRFKYQLKMDITIIQISEAKTIATGAGKADKVQMLDAIPVLEKDFILAVEKRKTKGLYDIADAYWIGKTRLRQLEVALAVTASTVL